MYLIGSHVLIVLGVLLVALAVILALQSRRTPQSAVAWILFIVLVPYLAVPVFLMLGFRKHRRQFAPIRFSQDTPAGDRVPATARLFRALGASEASAGNHLVLHRRPEAARAALETMLREATETLDVQFYIIANDESGRWFVGLLTEQARAGVKVRLSVDRLGTLRRPRRALNAFVAAGGELRFFSPLLHLPNAGQLNLRNHRKLVIADGRAVWSGGRNVGDEYLAAASGKWLDLSFAVTGPVVRSFAEVFASDWEVAGGTAGPLPGPDAAEAGGSLLQLVPAGPDEARDALHDGLVSTIYRARQRVWIATPYFVPTEALGLALATAARGGVDVRILVPARSNQWTTDLARGAYLRDAARAGCRVLRYRPGMLHAKAGLVDDVAWLGSANFDVRSMLLNFELALMIYDAETVAGVEEWFALLVPDCDEGVLSAALPRRLVEAVFRLGAPIL
jgi:cardiolipin synthase